MTYGIGIIGTGVIADFHARAVTQSEGGILTGCYDTVQSKAQEFAKKYGCRFYSSLKEMLTDPAMAAVSICTPSGAHLEPALEVLDAGKHLIVEKPLEVTVDRCSKMIRAAENRNLLLTGIFPYRFSKSARLLKEAVERGRFGKLTLGDAYVKWFRNQEYYDQAGWRGTWNLDGGGALMNQSIHAVDLLQWLMGPVTEVSAYTGTLAHQRIEVEDTAVAALKFSNGAMGVVEGSTAVYPGYRKRIEISGNRGSVVLTEETFEAWNFEKSEPEDELILENSKKKVMGGASDPTAFDISGHLSQINNFINSLEKKETLLIDGAEAAKAVEIIQAIYRSAETGKPVSLPLS